MDMMESLVGQVKILTCWHWGKSEMEGGSSSRREAKATEITPDQQPRNIIEEVRWEKRQAKRRVKKSVEEGERK